MSEVEELHRLLLEEHDRFIERYPSRGAELPLPDFIEGNATADERTTYMRHPDCTVMGSWAKTMDPAKLRLLITRWKIERGD